MPIKQAATKRLLSEDLRARVLAISVHFDFKVPPQHARRLAKAWRASSHRVRGAWGPYSSQGDSSLGLTVRSVNATEEPRQSFHAILEFRRRAVSPYRKIADEKMDAFVDCILRFGRSVRVASWRETIETAKDQLEPGVIRQLSEAVALTDKDGRTITFTGLEVSVAKPGEHPTRLSASWSGRNLVLVSSTSGQTFESVAELFDPEVRLVRLSDLNPKALPLEEKQ